jgi:hypothetical protein
MMDHGTQPSGWAALCCESATTVASSPKLRWYQHVARRVARATQDRNGLGKRRRLEAAALDASSVCPSMVDTTDDMSGGSDSSESASVSTSSRDTDSDDSLLEEDNFDDLCMSGVQQDVAKRRAAIQAARRAFQQQAKKKTARMNGLAKDDSDQEDFQPPFGQVCIASLAFLSSLVRVHVRVRDDTIDAAARVRARRMLCRMLIKSGPSCAPKDFK